MNNNQNNNNNIVKPTQVNLNNVNVDKSQDNFLNRERENIVSATIQANEAIDKDSAKTVNNEIKIKKNNPFVTALFVIIGLAVATVLSIGAITFIKNAENYGTDTNTTSTTTTVSKLQSQLNYLNNLNLVRKYQNAEYVLLLSPGSYDIVSNQNFYMLIKLGKTELVPKYGTYTINGNVVELTGTNVKSKKQLSVNENGLVMNNYILEKKDTEMKSYGYKDTTSAGVLIINGTPGNENALYIYSDTTTSHKSVKFTENDTSITLEDGTVFTKDGINIVNNGHTYNYIG